jgi:hypothetical protein
MRDAQGIHVCLVSVALHNNIYICARTWQVGAAALTLSAMPIKEKMSVPVPFMYAPAARIEASIGIVKRQLMHHHQALHCTALQA